MENNLPPRPWVFGYGRQSKGEKDQQYSREVQNGEVQSYVRQFLRGLHYRGLIFDEAVSGGTRFFDRAGGRVFIEQSQSGDHLVFMCVDRAFRDRYNGLGTIGNLATTGITVHFADEEIIVRDQDGIDDLNEHLTQAERERKKLGKRTKRGLRASPAAKGKYPPIGWDFVGEKADRRCVPHDLERTLICDLYRLWMLKRGVVSRETFIWQLKKQGIGSPDKWNGRIPGDHYTVVQLFSRCFGAMHQNFPVDYKHTERNGSRARTAEGKARLKYANVRPDLPPLPESVVSRVFTPASGAG